MVYVCRNHVPNFMDELCTGHVTNYHYIYLSNDSISSAFLPRAAGGRIQKAMSYVCHISGICSVPEPVICQVYSWYISNLGPWHIPHIYHTYTRHMKIDVI
jgi:hypothetical protein